MDYSRLPLPTQVANELRNYVYDVIACIHNVHNDLGAGFPEYIYQESLAIELEKAGFNIKREYEHHPIYNGHTLHSNIRMDIVIFKPNGNIIIECKAITAITIKERYQTYGYLRGTEFPIALLVNFGTYPHAQIEKYYYNDKTIKAF